MEQWFSSDWHIFHENIITFCDRPFKNADEMTEALIERHNALVKPEDHFTSLGDVTMIRGSRANQLRMINTVKRFNGHKRLILGNHDHFPVEVYLEAGFEKIYAMHMIDNIRFTHIAIHPDSMGQASANVHGHIHNQKASSPVFRWGADNVVNAVKPYINISLEETDYRPLTLGMIKERINDVVDDYQVTVKYMDVTVSGQHCFVCAPDDMKVEKFRCLEHVTTR